MENNYIEFIVGDDKRIDVVVNMLHGFMRNESIEFGISLAEYDYELNEVGDKVRAFADDATLNAILNNKQIADALNKKVMYLSANITAVPTSAKKVCFSIARNVVHDPISRAERDIRRFEKRHQRPMTRIEKRDMKKHWAAKATKFPCVFIQRKSTTDGNKLILPLFIKKHYDVTDANKFNSYGFAQNGSFVYEF